MKRVFEGNVCEDKTVNAQYQRLYLEDHDGMAIGTSDFFKGLEDKKIRIIIETVEADKT
jgi:hypothetical protein